VFWCSKDVLTTTKKIKQNKKTGWGNGLGDERLPNMSRFRVQFPVRGGEKVTKKQEDLSLLVEVSSTQRTHFKKTILAESWQLTHVILATQEAEIRSIAVQGQPRQIVLETLF
jgi:hypothetical protein